MRNTLLTILIVLATVFSIQNMHPVELIFIIWSMKTVTALVIVIALILGILIGVLLMLPAVIRNKRSSKQSQQHAADLESIIKQQSAHDSATDSMPNNSKF